MRCKSCDAPLRPSEIIWRPHQHKFEELCWSCRHADGLNVTYVIDAINELIPNKGDGTDEDE